MRIAIGAWHTPYLYLLARALPEHTIYALPTPYAPEGWLHYQRPQPENVETILAPSQGLNPPPDIVIAQTPGDLVTALGNRAGRVVYLGHNRAEFEPASLPVDLWAQRVPLVCISEMKAQSYRDLVSEAGYELDITVIPPGLPDEFYGGWTGKEPCILTVCNNIRRPLFDVDAWVAATHDLPTLLVGEGNDGIPGAMGPAKSWEELKGFYRDCRVYLNPTCPPYEDPFNLAALEALATGCPVRNVGPYIGKEPSLEDFSWEKFRAQWRQVVNGVAG